MGVSDRDRVRSHDRAILKAEVFIFCLSTTDQSQRRDFLEHFI